MSCKCWSIARRRNDFDVPSAAPGRAAFRRLGQRPAAMRLESVRAFFAEKAADIAVVESPMSSATVALAAEAYGVEPGRIAKTLSLRIGERVVLIVASGASRMDNKKLKACVRGKTKMLGLDEVAEITGHE